jgi:16S rRNA (adenine1518-N6/adenine1519-N6)-dimethyltransferase
VATFELADAAFGQRRKTMRQAISGWAGSAADAERTLVTAGVSPQARGEQLDVHDFLKIVRAANV